MTPTLAPRKIEARSERCDWGGEPLVVDDEFGDYLQDPSGYVGYVNSLLLENLEMAMKYMKCDN